MKKNIVLLLIFLMLFISAGYAVLYHKLTVARQELTEVRHELLDSVLSEKTEQLTSEMDNPHDKALSIARWISSNISNRTQPGGDVYTWYAERAGYCGARTILFVKMLSYQNIPAEVFNVYFSNGDSHSCAQVFYGGKWHFFDVTYAGVFIKDNDVLSWDEITADPEDALENMVVFGDTIDRYSNGESVDNYNRMQYVYTVKSLRNAVGQIFN